MRAEGIGLHNSGIILVDELDDKIIPDKRKNKINIENIVKIYLKFWL